MTVEVWFELFIPPATAFYCRNQVDTLVVLYRFCHANQIAFSYGVLTRPLSYSAGTWGMT
jgi:hypothetical protein